MYYQIVSGGVEYWPLVIGEESLKILRERLQFNAIQVGVQQLTLHKELANAGVGIPQGRDLRNRVDCTGVKFYLIGAVK